MEPVFKQLQDFVNSILLGSYKTQLQEVSLILYRRPHYFSKNGFLISKLNTISVLYVICNVFGTTKHQPEN